MHIQAAMLAQADPSFSILQHWTVAEHRLIHFGPERSRPGYGGKGFEKRPDMTKDRQESTSDAVKRKQLKEEIRELRQRKRVTRKVLREKEEEARNLDTAEIAKISARIDKEPDSFAEKPEQLQNVQPSTMKLTPEGFVGEQRHLFSQRAANLVGVIEKYGANSEEAKTICTLMRDLLQEIEHVDRAAKTEAATNAINEINRKLSTVGYRIVAEENLATVKLEPLLERGSLARE